MEKIFVIVLLFASTAASMYFSMKKWQMVASGLIVLNLCLIVALAALLGLIEKIIWLIVGVMLMFVAFVALHYYLKKQTNSTVSHEIVKK